MKLGQTVIASARCGLQLVALKLKTADARLQAPLVGCTFSQEGARQNDDGGSLRLAQRVDNIINVLDEIMDHMDGFSSAEEAWLSSITETLRTWRYVMQETYESPEGNKMTSTPKKP